MILEYNSISENIQAQLIEKKSKFIGDLINVENEKMAKNEINKIKKKYYDAKHHVFAYIIYDNGILIEKYSDDGEPTGTAGKPLLDILKQNAMSNVLIVITRYFGGILLGTGGLMHAYSDTCLECMKKVNKCCMKYSSIIELEVNYEQIDDVKHFCEINNYKIRNIEYLEKIKIDIVIYEEDIDKFKNSIENFFNKSIDMTIKEKTFVKK